MTHKPAAEAAPTGLLQRTLQLRAGEWHLITAMGSLLLVNSFAIQLSYVASVSGLLERGQVLGLPSVWLVSYLLTLGLTSVQLRVIDRYDKRRLLMAVSLLFALLLYAVWWGLHLSLPSVLTYGLLYIVADQQWLVFPLVFWAMCSDVLTMAQAKRLFPVIASIGFVGKILGLTVVWLAPLLAGTLHLHLPQLLLLSFLLYILAAVLSLRLQHSPVPYRIPGAVSVRSAPTGTVQTSIAGQTPTVTAGPRVGRGPRAGWLPRRRWSPGHWDFAAWLRARSGAVIDHAHWGRQAIRQPPQPAPPPPASGPARSTGVPVQPAAAPLPSWMKTGAPVQRPLPAPSPPAPPRRHGPVPARDALSTGWQFIQDVPIFKYQALCVGVLAACETLLEFVFLFRLEHAFSQSEQYQHFYSGYRFLTSLMGFALQALVTSRVIERLTLRNALSVTAVVLCGVATTMLLLPVFLITWVGMGVTRVVRDTIDESSQKALQAVIPSDKRGRVSLLIDSYILSLGTVASCLLLLALWRVFPAWTDDVRLSVLMGMALALAAVGVWSVLRLRQVYDSSLLNWRLRRRQRGGDVLERLEF